MFYKKAGDLLITGIKRLSQKYEEIKRKKGIINKEKTIKNEE